ncbi:hypothetical protein B7494_g8150 [Chlorociboria aeruginascens]|nr:hypothetical protein B7494_g8150 [Chlorociboria aeruginascens]
MTTPYEKALVAIDAAHSLDPTLTTSEPPIPYELHYAQKMTHYLELHTPGASPLLQLAIRAQHFRRWEVPRASYPATKAGYLSWRSFLRKRQAEMVREICVAAGCSEEDAQTVAAYVRKDGLGRAGDEGNRETQVLEDVACLVFLDDQLAGYVDSGGLGDEAKMIGILRKTWCKMGERGRQLALKMKMSDDCIVLIGRALDGA